METKLLKPEKSLLKADFDPLKAVGSFVRKGNKFSCVALS